MNILNAMLQSILKVLKVESSGIWNYIKLPGGWAFCWGTYTETKVKYSTFAPFYGYATSKIMFPFTFMTRPIVRATVTIGAGFAFHSGNLSALKTDGFVCYGASTDGDGKGALITCDMLVIGRWK